MEAFVRNFIRASLCWLAFGVLLGTAMTFSPALTVYRPAHLHANLLGFVSMMIFGVAYHVLPRFTGRPLHSRRLAAAHLVVANAGLSVLIAGWLALPHLAAGRNVLRAGALISATGVFMFIHNIWSTLQPAGAGLTPLTTKWSGS